MADGPSLSDRMRDLRMREAAEAGPDALERAQAEKARLSQRLRAMSGEGGPSGAAGDGTGEAGRSEAAHDEAGQAVARDDAREAAAEYGGGPGRAGDAATGTRPATRAARVSKPKFPAAAPGVHEDDDEVAQFVARTLSDRLRARQMADQTASAEAVHPVQAAPASRAMRWLLGKDVQEEGAGIVTPIPALPPEWEEVEFIDIEPPFSFVRLRRHTRTGEMLYEVIEPPLLEKEQRILEFVQDALVRGLTVDPGSLKPEERLEYLMEAVRRILWDYRVRIDRTGQARVEYYLRRDFLGLGEIHVPMVDDGIEDISCDGAAQPLFIFHRQHESIPSNIRFRSDGELDAFVIKLAQRSGKAISISDPILDAALPDGSRLQATLGQEVTQNGSTFTIRRFRPDPFTPIDLIRFGTMDPAMLAYFWLIVQHGQSLIFSGGTASGKTTGLNAICQFIPHQAKIVSIEDTREVNLPHRNWIKSVTRAGSTHEGSGEVGMFELLKASLRQRPEYILVGEVRGVEATVAFQAMATGHTVYSTMHADSARSVVYRLENEPISIPRLVLQALDVIAIQAQVRFQGERVRRVKEVVELVGLDPATKELLTNTVFRWDPATDTFQYGGRSYLLERIAEAANWTPARLAEEFERRQLVLKWLMDGPRLGVDRLGAVIRTYYRDPVAFAEHVRSGGGVEGIIQEAEDGT